MIDVEPLQTRVQDGRTLEVLNRPVPEPGVIWCNSGSLYARVSNFPLQAVWAGYSVILEFWKMPVPEELYRYSTFHGRVGRIFFSLTAVTYICRYVKLLCISEISRDYWILIQRKPDCLLVSIARYTIDCSAPRRRCSGWTATMFRLCFNYYRWISSTSQDAGRRTAMQLFADKTVLSGG